MFGCAGAELVSLVLLKSGPLLLDLYIVRGESGQDFIAAVLRNVLADDDLGSNRTWRGTLQGFRVIKEGEESRMLPVLLVDKIE